MFCNRFVIDIKTDKLVPPDPPGQVSAAALRNKDVSDPRNRASPVSMFDRLLDVLFVVTLSQLATPLFRGVPAESMWIEFFCHWVPVYFTWFGLEVIIIIIIIIFHF